MKYILIKNTEMQTQDISLAYIKKHDYKILDPILIHKCWLTL